VHAANNVDPLPSLPTRHVAPTPAATTPPPAAPLSAPSAAKTKASNHAAAPAPAAAPSTISKFQSPPAFQPNVRPVADSGLRYVARSAGIRLFLSDDGATFSFPGQSGGRDAVKLHLDGANPDPTIVGQDARPGHTNYFVNGHSFQNVSHWGSVLYRN